MSTNFVHHNSAFILIVAKPGFSSLTTERYKRTLTNHHSILKKSKLI